MRRGTMLLPLILVASGTSRTEGCGDKFLRVGRGARYQRAYVAVHPANLLLVARAGSSVGTALRELQPALKRAGHRSLIVESPSAVAPALTGSHYNLILLDLHELGSVQTAAKASGTRVDLLPFLDRPTAAARAAAERDYRYVAETPGKKVQVLAQIDELMEIALKGTGEDNRKLR